MFCALNRWRHRVRNHADGSVNPIMARRLPGETPPANRDITVERWFSGFLGLRI